MPLYSAAVPDFYRRIAAAPDDVRVLELPFGIRDGTSSVGDFTARSQFYQTVHGKRLIGGYLSRVSSRRVRDTRRDPMLDALIWLSEGRELDASRWRSLVETGPAFVERAKVGFVVIDRRRTTRAIREFANTRLRAAAHRVGRRLRTVRAAPLDGRRSDGRAFALARADRDQRYACHHPRRRPGLPAVSAHRDAIEAGGADRRQVPAH